MATADKARQKLVETMRKSKSGAASKPSTGSHATPARKTAARRAPAARPAARGQRPATTAAAMLAVTRQTSDDPYQSDGRIWPD